MRQLSTMVMGVLAFAVSAGAAAQKPEPAPSPAKEKKVCRSESVTGSMMPHRTCRTVSEWKQQDEANSAGVEAFRNRPPTAGGVNR